VEAAAQDAKVKIEIEGLNGDLERNVRAMMELARAAENGPLTRFRIGQLHQRADEDIEVALEPFGYYQPRIVKFLEQNGEEWIARYIIEPGPVVTVRSVNVALTGPGADQPAFRAAADGFPLKAGQPLHHAAYELGKLGLLAVATDSGYLDADFDTSAVIVDESDGQADIRIVFETGERFRFGPVWFDQDILDEEFLRTRIPFRQGDLWRQDKVAEFQNALSEDPYFARVEILPRRDSAQGLEVPVRVSLAPNKRLEYELGLGYGTDTGPRGRAAGLWRWVTRSGHHARADIMLSPVEQQASAEYTIPAVLHPTGNLTFIGGYAMRRLDTYDSRILTTAVRLGRKRLGWRELLSVGFLRESFEVGPDTGVASLFIAGGSWERVRQDNLTFPRRGLRTRFRIQGGTSFAQLEAGAKVVYGIARNMRVLTRVDAGRIFTNEFRNLPPTLRYFTGGDQTVRGFGYQTLATTDTLGNVIGGRTLVAGSVELDFWPVPRWGVATFFDTGNAMERFAWSELEQGFGAGVRYLSPLGLIRLDGAFPSRGNFRIHISIGPDL
jgi:translocation and assembly module TamA